MYFKNKSPIMNTALTPTTKYGLSFGLFESASKNLIIPIAELGPPPSEGFDFVNFTIQHHHFYMSTELFL